MFRSIYLLSIDCLSLSLSLSLSLTCMSCVSDQFQVSETQYQLDQQIAIMLDQRIDQRIDQYIDQRIDQYIDQQMDQYIDQFMLNDMNPQVQQPIIDWIFIEAGSFMMGPTKGVAENEYPEELPIRRVNIEESFLIAKTEVTVAQYRTCVQAGICSLPQDLEGCNWFQNDIEQHPINCINWLQARRFAHWVGGELPTEAQWEYAGRSKGLDVIFPWGDEDPNCDRLNYDQPCFRQTTAVCALPQGNTPLGLCDMAGNVSEFMLDHYHPGYEQAPTNQEAWCDTLNCEIIEDRSVSIRGGSWGNPYYHGVRVTHRNRSMAINPEYPNNGGFRIVKKVDLNQNKAINLYQIKQ